MGFQKDDNERTIFRRTNAAILAMTLKNMCVYCWFTFGRKRNTPAILWFCLKWLIQFVTMEIAHLLLRELAMSHVGPPHPQYLIWSRKFRSRTRKRSSSASALAQQFQKLNCSMVVLSLLKMSHFPGQIRMDHLTKKRYLLLLYFMFIVFWFFFFILFFWFFF